MKMPDRIVGFLVYNEKNYTFELNKISQLLYLYPQNRKEWRDDNNPVKWFKSLQVDLKKHEWTNEILLQGTTSEEYSIIFGVSEENYSYNSFYSFFERQSLNLFFR